MGSSLENRVALGCTAHGSAPMQTGAGVLHYSYRGCQHASATYRQALADHGCLASMSQNGNCYDLATMKLFWSTLKHELVYRCRWSTRAQTTIAIFNYCACFCNRTRL